MHVKRVVINAIILTDVESCLTCQLEISHYYPSNIHSLITELVTNLIYLV